MFTSNLVSILIPAYNERPYVRKCIERSLNAPLPENLKREIIVVDDGSADGTGEVLERIAAENPSVVKVFHLDRNTGKGAAIRRAVKEMSGEYAIFQDADLEYDPGEYGALLEPLLEGVADVVYGSRFAPRRMKRVFNFHHAVGNKFLTFVSDLTTGLDLTDMETCYKAFRSDILKTIPLRSKRFGIEPEITAKVAKPGCAVYEVPISYRGRSYAEGKKIRWKDGVSAFYYIVKYWIIDDCFEENYGQAVLTSLSHARKFNRWMAEIIEPWLGNSILEIGSGIGNLSRQLPLREKLILTDIDPKYLEILKNAFKDNDNVEVRKLDITSREDFNRIGIGICDTVICLNVLEHIEDDKSALSAIGGLLAPGGRLILVVPQYPKLYGSYDKAVGHFRRYTSKGLQAMMKQAGFRIIKKRSFNFLSIFGWWVNSCVLKRKSMGRIQLKLYDTMVPVMKVVEGMLPLPGVSIVCVGEKVRTGRSERF